MKATYLAAVVALALSQPVGAQSVTSNGPAADARTNQIVATEVIKMIRSLRPKGVDADTFILNVRDLNPEKCCTVITPDEVRMECPCKS